jgi:hypothetical protein
MMRNVGPAAALAGTPVGVQAQGVWIGRRQLFVRFAAEAETATMYTANALTTEIERALARSAIHSISIAGRDPLANVEYLAAALSKSPERPVMLDCDGQRPDAVGALEGRVQLVQVTLEGEAVASEASLQRALETLGGAAKAGLDHAIVIGTGDQTSDAILLRIVEQSHAVSDAMQVVVHPPGAASLERDKRWVTLLEQLMTLHRDVRLTVRLPAPTGMR